MTRLPAALALLALASLPIALSGCAGLPPVAVPAAGLEPAPAGPTTDRETAALAFSVTFAELCRPGGSLRPLAVEESRPAWLERPPFARSLTLRFDWEPAHPLLQELEFRYSDDGAGATVVTGSPGFADAVGGERFASLGREFAIEAAPKSCALGERSAWGNAAADQRVDVEAFWSSQASP